MQYKKLATLFYFILFTCKLDAQSVPKEYNFISPVDFPILLSGNYGELRSSHFHAGIDIKTQGVIGKKVYAVENGYIARIKVSANGYGKTLYLNHPNGYTSVYAHLNNFNDTISDFIKKLQYDKNSFEINYFPKKGDFPIKKGEVIAFSGNTGGSLGPHLHFEIRKTASQVPINPLLFNFNLKDTIAPKFYRLTLYPLSNNSFINTKNQKQYYPVSKNNDYYILKDTTNIIVSGNIGIGIELNDFLNGSKNRCGIYKLKLLINKDTIYSHIIDNISFSETGYIKSHVDYAEKINHKKTIQKTFIAPNNNLSIYNKRVNNGIYNFNKDTIYNILLIADDAYGNQSILKFKLIGKTLKTKANNIKKQSANFMDWKSSNTFKNEDITVVIPKRALYDTLYFNFSKSSNYKNSITPVFNIHNETVPLQKKFSLSINIGDFNQNLKEKLFIVNIDKENKLNPVGGEVINNTITASTKEFGKYTVMVDTLNPVIETVKKDESILINGKIKFIIKDDLSGIKSYNGYIDNKWALFEYDMKNDLLFYEIDSKRLENKKNHELELFIIDNTGNISTYYTTFYW